MSTDIKYSKFSKGFTLLELVIVFGIVGLLASIAWVFVSQSKEDGNDGGIKQNLINARTKGEFYYNGAPTSTLSYLGVCGDRTNGIQKHVDAAARVAGVSLVLGNGQDISATDAVCHDTGAGWAAGVPLKGGNAWCADSTGVSKQVVLSALDTNGDITCN